MPELPEVETTKKGLKKEIVGEKFIKVVPLWRDIIKDVPLSQFKKEIRGQKIIDVRRRAKNLLVFIENNKVLVIHFKMTGHALVVPDKDYKLSKEGKWIGFPKTHPLSDPQNQFIRIVFELSGGKKLAISDLRKFASIKLLDKENLDRFLSQYGPEALDIDFGEFKERIKSKKTSIKKSLMDQSIIAGVGNIYSDEALFEAGIKPLRKISTLKEEELARLYQAIKKVLKKALELRGTSTSDYRDIKGLKGSYDKVRKVYRREGEKCPRCETKIKRIKIGGRSAHFCPRCQK